ncbi:anti-H(O) lectin 1-like [Tripterygium wilfordii]|uniref:anti-H(O) lectin 1-like n=1 Tax=Tripterygium wilfordii TaxID=458696 RepID=UPI0018F82A4A|nr:anti-H(O) lectin 1-like [Tripterygium wilfordii]
MQLNQVGRVLYKYPVFAWPAYIYSTFTFRILTSPYSTESADGLTFIIAPKSSPSPTDSFGSYLGIMDPAQDGRAADQLAVEFDTYKNTFDFDGNHVSIDTKSVIHPIQVRSLNDTGIDLKSGRDIKVLIVLDGSTKSIRVHIGYASDPIDGLTFIMAPDSSPSPSDSYGSYLGIMDPAQDGHAGGQLAVEFDTYKNTGDLDANHIAVVTKSVIHPIEARSLNDTGIDLKSGRDIKVLIVLDGRTKSIRVHVGYAFDPIGETFLEVPIDIPNTLPSFIYVGFTASTGLLTERHQILNWNLASFPINK